MIGLGSTSTLGIGLVVELRDHFTQNANKINRSLNDLHGNAERSLRNSFNSMTGVGTGMAVVGLGIAKGLQVATKEAMSFQKAMLSIKAMGGMTNAETTTLSQFARTMGPKYATDPTKFAEGMLDLVKAGLKAKEIPKVMEAIIQTAIAADEKLEGEGGVAARMTDIIMAWGMTANQAGRAGDILAKASIESTVSFNNLSESMRYSQDVLKGLHMTFEESVAMMAVLGNSGIKASMAGTSLANAWREVTIALGGGSKKKNMALHALGLSPKDLMDAQGNLRRPLEILDQIKKGVAGMGDVQRQNVLNDLFGVRGKRGVNPLIDFLTKDPGKDKWMGKSLQDMVATLTNKSAGSNMAIIEEKAKGAAFQAKQFESTWANFKISVGQAIIPLLNVMLPIITKVVSKLSDFASSGFGQKMVKTLGIMAAILIPAGAFLTILGLTGRMLLSMQGGVAAWGSAAKWVWTTLISKALTYLGIMKGIKATERINSAGSVIDAATGRFVKGGMGKFAGRTAAKGILGRFTMGIGRLIPGIGSLASGVGGVALGFARFIPIIGWAVTIMGALSASGISLKRQLQMVVGSITWVFASFANVLKGIANFFTFGNAFEGSFGSRQDEINYTSFHDDPYTKEKSEATKQQGIQSGYHPRNDTYQGGKETNVHIYVDGQKAMSKKIKDDEEINLESQYGFSH